MMEKNLKQPYWQDALMAFGRMSGWVAGPIIIALIAGKMLDKKFGTEPYFFIAIVGVGFFVSVFGIFREAKKYVAYVEEKERALKAAKTTAGGATANTTNTTIETK